MKAMQKFQPLMNKLREKYKDDPQRLNAEMMKLYKEHKINPFSGCLPMLVQIPVFFALLRDAAQRHRIARRGVSVDQGPVATRHDLTIQPMDPSGVWRSVNPLPLAMTGSMVWQQNSRPRRATRNNRR